MSSKVVDGVVVGSQEASKDFVNYWKEMIDPDYKSPYRQNNNSRMLELYYFKEDENLSAEIINLVDRNATRSLSGELDLSSPKQ